ncbi:MAG TPA: FAD-linked oxidase C-terminal domain-containing protein [Balneolaceae bacterium]
MLYTDEQTRRLYAQDASSYEELPLGVAFPASLTEIRALVSRANQEQFSITARGAGTSLAGQATGGGVVMDLGRKMNRILEINPDQHFTRVQPGVIRDTLNREAYKHNLLFGPDTATTSRCMLGGMIGNNSCGSFSIKHKTTREHVLEIEAVLSDGSVAIFKPLNEQELSEKMKLDSLEGHIYREMISLIREHRESILENYPHPDITRRNTGYALDRLCEMQPFNAGGRPFNLAELLCGSEGTLAITASAKVNLVPVDHEKVVLVPHFSSLRSAMEATVEAVKMNPSAVELVDYIILDATRRNIEQRQNRFFLDGEPNYILIIQFDGQDSEPLFDQAQKLAHRLNSLGLSTSIPIITDNEKVERVWHLRKAGLGLLMGLGSEGRTPTFCEDTAVRVEDLPDYVDDFQKILDKYESKCVFYAHASVGELHLRPVINLQEPEGIAKMKAMAEEIAGLVRSYRGSLSGEHGDGRTRAPFIEKVLGSEMMPLLKQVKKIWDPKNIFNPGKIVNPKPMEDDLRYSPAYRPPKVETHFNWRKEETFADAVELCNGAGACRKLAESGGTMCPSYMVTKEEKDSTRGRANLFRQLFSGRQKDAFQSEELRDALDLCISCKGCKSECPANVDMARMKAEFMQGWHDENGTSLGERFFAQAATFYPFASKFPRFSNRMLKQPAVKEVLYQLFNISWDRTLPAFADEPFMKWFRKRSFSSDRWVRDRMSGSRRGIRQTAKNKSRGIRQTTSAAVGRRVVLFVDLFTNYHEPEIGKAAVQFLEAMGYEVFVPDFYELGRPQISKGMLRQAKKILDENLPKLGVFADAGIPVIGLEPSEILTLRDEYLDLCDEGQIDSAEKVAENSFTFEEFTAEVLAGLKVSQLNHSKQKVYVHGHCHAKALIGDIAVNDVLEKAGYHPEILDTGCCGMAGSFGYEANHYNVSMDIGELRLFPSLRNLPEDTLICAPGFSCRHQINDGTGRKAFHPAELIAKAFR